VTFQAALANSSVQSNAGRGATTTASGSKTHSGASSAGRTASKQENERSPASLSHDGTAANVAVPPVEQRTVPEQGSPNGQENGPGDGSGSGSGSGSSGSAGVGTAADGTATQLASGTPELAQPMSAAGRVASALQLSEAAAGRAGEGVAPVGGLAAGQIAAPAAGQIATPAAPSADAQSVPVASDAAETSGQAAAGGETFQLQMELPAGAGVPSGLPGGVPAGKGDSSQTMGKASQKSVGGAAGGKNSDAANTNDAGKAKATDAVSAAGDGSSSSSSSSSSHGAQSDGQSMQHSQADGAQVVAATAKVTDGGPAQAQAVPMQAAIHEATGHSGEPGGVANGTHLGATTGDTVSSPLDGDEATATSGINAAQIIQAMGETEMRVGMHSAEFGNVSIRTSVTQQQMLAQISVDHGDLSQAISAHIPTMQTKLGNDYGLQASIQVNHQGAFGSGPGDQGGSEPREQRGFSSSVRSESAAVPTELDVGMSMGALTGAGDGYRLDISA